MTYADAQPVMVPVVYFCGHTGEIAWYPGLDPEPDEAALKRRARYGMQCMDCYSATVTNERQAGLR